MTKELSPLKQYLLGLALVVFSGAFASFIILYLALKPDLQASQQAKEVATAAGQLVTSQMVERYSGESLYYSVYGQNQAGQDLVVSINQADGQIYINQLTQGITAKEAKVKAQENGAGAIKRTVFGIYQGQAIWEVTSGKAYYLIDFVTGNLVKKEGI